MERSADQPADQHQLDSSEEHSFKTAESKGQGRELPEADTRTESAMLVELAAAFADLVDHLGGGDPGHLSGQAMTNSIRGFFPGVQHIELVEVGDGQFRGHGPVDETCRQIQVIAQATGSGPVHDVLEVNDVVVCNDVGAESRWPAWTTRVEAETAVCSVLVYRLYLNRTSRAALSLYSEWPHAFSESDVALGSVFASYCSLVLLSEVLLKETLSASRAVDVHREIGVALAILVGHGEGDVSGAYHSLHEATSALREGIAGSASA